MARKRLTDAFIRSLKPAPKGKRDLWMDEVSPRMGVRVTDKGQASFGRIDRYPGSRNPTFRELGVFGKVPMRPSDAPVMELAKAREKNGAWARLLAEGIDPREHEEQKRTAARRVADTTFGAVVEVYLQRHVRGQRKAAQVEREIRGDLIPAWGRKPVTAITRADVIELVESIADRTRAKVGNDAATSYHAHNVFGHARTFFNWAIMRGTYGLETSPCDRVNVAQLVGQKKPRQRTLDDDELRAYWRAASRLGYPFGPMFKLIALLGGRRAEIAEVQRSEFPPKLFQLMRKEAEEGEAVDWPEVAAATKLWTVPPERFKSDASHLVPLSDWACEVLAELPRLKGSYLFSTTHGAKPVSGFSKAKDRLDRRMERTLKAMARMRGEDPRAVRLTPFVNHDLRRTVRTQLSKLRIPDTIAEMVIGHGRKGIQRVYDQHSYEPEMREALDAWAKRLREIVTPAPANVIQLPSAARAEAR